MVDIVKANLPRADIHASVPTWKSPDAQILEIVAHSTGVKSFVGVLTPWVSAAAGFRHSLARLASGSDRGKL